MGSVVRHVLAIPYPGRGHINPMLNLAGHLAARGLVVTVVVTEEWLGLLSSAPAPPPAQVRLKTIPNVIPSEHGRGGDFSGFVDAVNTRMEAPVEKLIEQLEQPANAIVADPYVTWALAVGQRQGVPVYALWTMPAALFSIFFDFEELFGVGDQRPPQDPEETDERLEQYVHGLNLGDLNTIISGKSLKWALIAFENIRKSQGVLFTSVYELESRTIDSLRSKLPCPVYTVGPCIPYKMLQESSSLQQHGSRNYLEWLDSQAVNSVLYLSLGSFLSVSGPQMDEIAAGLHASGIRFLWVARGDASRVQEMTGGKGLVVPWCDQLRVLCHPSVGCFLTHCGWNSTLEAVFAGLPVLGFPLFWDQPINCRLIANEWRIGLNVKEGCSLVGGDAIAKLASRLMDMAENESKEMRRRARELRKISLTAIEDGGSSNSSLCALVKDLMRERDV